MRRIVDLVLIAVIIGTAYAYRDSLMVLGAQLYARFAPCARPLYYSIGEFDTRFGVSKTDFLSVIEEAEAVWEKPPKKELFAYAEKGPLTISLKYDTRQETTKKLQTLGIEVDENLASYHEIETRYLALKADYLQERTAFESAVSRFTAQQSEYTREVRMWNSRGGAPPKEYERLQRQKSTLDEESMRLEAAQQELNKKADDVNALVEALNRLADVLNLHIAKYNMVGRSVGTEFEEGSYQESPGSMRIEIYEFSSRDKLVRVLAHELGHALGLPHVDDPDAIMYRLNQSKNERATATDVASLKTHCRLSS